MITVKSNKEVIDVRFGDRAIQAVYRGARLVWEKVKHLSAWFRTEGYFRSEPW